MASARGVSALHVQFCTTIRFGGGTPPASAWPLRMIRNRPSGAMSYGLATLSHEHCEFEQHLRTPDDERRPGLHRDRKHLPTVQAAEEQFPARHATRAGYGRRPSRSVADFRALDIARRRSPFDQTRSTRRPSSVRLETRPSSRCEVALHQHLRLGRALDGDLPDRALIARPAPR